MSVEYVCVDIVESQGVYDCKKWVAHQSQEPILTKAQTQEIGGVLVLFFASVVCYLIITKAIKIA